MPARMSESPRGRRIAAIASAVGALCASLLAFGTAPASAAGTWSLQGGTMANLNGADCPDQATCWAVGNGGAILATTDAGSTWSTQVSGSTAQLNAISCPTTTTCVAAGKKAPTNGAILTTADGGATWSARNSGVGQC